MFVTMWTRYGKCKSSTVTMNLDTEPRRRVVTSAYLDLEIRFLFLEAHDRLHQRLRGSTGASLRCHSNWGVIHRAHAALEKEEPYGCNTDRRA